MWDMNYPQIMSPVPFASKRGGHVPLAPMGAPPMPKLYFYVHYMLLKRVYDDDDDDKWH